MSECLQDAIRETIPKSLNKPLVVSVSGGVDSMVLLHVLHSMGFPLVVAHVNHQKREASEKEYEAIMEYCATIGVPFEGTRYKGEAGNFQAKARNFRLNFLKDTARKYGSRHILTAHHRDDRIETFLMRFSEGRSLNALTSIRTVFETEGMKFVKPFLSIPKSALMNYAEDHAIPYSEDSSNQDVIYTRNFIRHKLLPRFNELNP
ncbi:MAG: tRNA lysidine(34) synthetase TilS, partial [Candidatus Izemoplasmataceae bacterium]